MAFIVSAFLTSNTMQPKAELWENTEKQKGKTWAPMSQLKASSADRLRCGASQPEGTWGQRAQQGRSGLPARPHAFMWAFSTRRGGFRGRLFPDSSAS